LVERRPLRELAAALQIGAGGVQVLAVLVEHPGTGRSEVGEDVGLAAAVGEVDLQQLLELEDRSVAWLLQPRGERPAALGGDGVASPPTTAGRVVGRAD